MLFRPKFCCNCGEPIERVEWRIWTSRRFCELCATEYKHIDLLPFGSIALGIFLSILGFAAYFRGTSGTPDVVRIDRPANSVRQLKPSALLSVSNENTSVQASVLKTIPGNSAVRNSEQPVRKAETSENAVFYCGAVTKKGTPCTRRVKTKGFCWQHIKTGQLAPTKF